MSKTDQLGLGTMIEIVPSTESSLLYSSLSNFLKIRPNFDGPLFCHFNGEYLTAYQFSQMLKKCVKFLGIDTSTFKSHSFRIGCASDLFVRGKTEDEIKEIGRWKSNAYKSYIRI